jgi:hypothetical protein
VTADELISKAVKVAIKEYSKEQKSERRRKALHNTKMLLKNYDKIKSSIEEAISEASQLEEQSFAYSDDEDVYINSIRKSKLKSLIVVAHIDRALDVVAEDYDKKGVMEKYDAFISCFMHQMSYEEAAAQYLSSKTSISRWVNEVTKELSIQLFGVDGVDFI